MQGVITTTGACDSWRVNALANRLTDALGMRHPIISAPMAYVAGGALAAAVSRAGGLGLIGGGYGDAEWIDDQFDAARGERIGIGFITWSAAQTPSVVAASLQRQPAAVMLSFGDPMAFAADVHAAGAVLICQCQNLAHVRAALDAEADIVVAQDRRPADTALTAAPSRSCPRWRTCWPAPRRTPCS